MPPKKGARGLTLWKNNRSSVSNLCRKKNGGGLGARARFSVSSDIPFHSTHSVLVNYRATKKRGSWPRFLAKQKQAFPVSILCRKNNDGGLGALARSSVSSDSPFHSTHSVLVIYGATKKGVRGLALWQNKTKSFLSLHSLPRKKNDGGLGALARSSVSSYIPCHSTHSVLVIYRATKKGVRGLAL